MCFLVTAKNVGAVISDVVGVASFKIADSIPGIRAGADQREQC